jgi:hypothetical protein
MAADVVEVEVGDRLVRVTNPGRVYFPARGETRLDLVRYYLWVGDGIVRALRERPCMMHRFPSGVAGDKVHQKRVPRGAPPWLQTVRVHFPRYDRVADELCVTELAAVVWTVQMSTVEFHPVLSGHSCTPGQSSLVKIRRKLCSKKPSGSGSTPHRGIAPGWTWLTDPGYGGTGGSPSRAARWCPRTRSLTLWEPPPGRRERCTSCLPRAGDPGNASPARCSRLRHMTENSG